MFTTMTQPLVRSVNWSDLYKITMSNAIWQLYPKADARYLFINRGKVAFPLGFAELFEEQLQEVSQLTLSHPTINWMRSRIPGLSEKWLQWYGDLQMNPEEVRVRQKGGVVEIVVEGPWYRTVLWETLLLSLVSNLYNKMSDRTPILNWTEEAYKRASRLRELGAMFIEFGTRRAFSPEIHEDVLRVLIETAGNAERGGVLLGTSNVFLAEKYNLKPIGTFAHEWVMGHAGLYGYREANTTALTSWLDVYKGAHAVALTDTFTTEVFLRSFDTTLAQGFTGVRQDSGDPLVMADTMIAHYEQIGVDPRTKIIVFSDNLNVERVERILRYCEGRIQAVFGIGTDLTNAVTGLPSLNIVMKLNAIRKDARSNWTDVVKLSDDPIKIAGNSQAVLQAYTELGVQA